MRTLVQSLKRLFNKGIVGEAKIRSMTEEEKITAAEYEYITGNPYVEE
ncbi:MAG: XkdX family protein [Lachnospiraceae bacterium]|nr:XkdX family protein [Lachnospiraceae bacterium]